MLALLCATLRCLPTSTNHINTLSKETITQPVNMEAILTTIVCLSQAFDPVILTTMLEHIITSNRDELEKTFVSFKGTGILLSIPLFQLRNKILATIPALLPSKVNEVFDNFMNKPRQAIRYDLWGRTRTIEKKVMSYEHTKYILFHAMTFKAMLTFVNRFNSHRWCYYANDREFFLPKHFNLVRKAVAEYYMKNFASAEENLDTVYDFMDNNDVTYEYFEEHLPGRYQRTSVNLFTFTSLLSVYEYQYELKYNREVADYFNNEIGEWVHGHTSSLVAFIDEFGKNFDFTSFVNEKLIDKEYESILFLRTQIHEDEYVNGTKYSGEYYDPNVYSPHRYPHLFKDEDLHDTTLKYPEKENHHAIKMAKKKCVRKQTRREKNRRGGRHKRPLVEQFS